MEFSFTVQSFTVQVPLADWWAAAHFLAQLVSGKTETSTSTELVLTAQTVSTNQLVASYALVTMAVSIFWMLLLMIMYINKCRTACPKHKIIQEQPTEASPFQQPQQPCLVPPFRIPAGYVSTSKKWHHKEKCAGSGATQIPAFEVDGMCKNCSNNVVFNNVNVVFS